MKWVVGIVVVAVVVFILVLIALDEILDEDTR